MRSSQHPTINVRITGSLYFAVSTPCGESWAGMTESDDLPIQVRKALRHADACVACKASANTRSRPPGGEADV